MLKKMPIRVRFMTLNIILLTVCCVGLTVILNLSANKMAKVIATTPITTIPTDPSNPPPEDQEPMTPLIPAEEVKTAKQGFRFESMIYLLVIILAGGVLNYYLSGMMLKPLKTLSKQMKKRNVNNLAEEITLPSARDELLELTKSFNEMTHTLNDSFLMEQRFAQNAAHELRTPLTVVKTKIEVFQKKQDHSQTEYNALLDVIDNQTNHLTKIVKNLLDMTNQEEIELKDEVLISSLLEEVVLNLSSFADDKNIKVTLESSDISLLCNYDLLYRACYNILENAIRYNNELGHVKISVINKDNSIQINFLDTGIGIPKDKLEHIFEPFYRVDKSRSKELGGIGLGLPMVKSIIEKHQGKILIEPGKNGGTMFQVIFNQKKKEQNRK